MGIRKGNQNLNELVQFLRNYKAMKINLFL